MNKHIQGILPLIVAKHTLKQKAVGIVQVKAVEAAMWQKWWS